jgi:hypothetical protein
MLYESQKLTLYLYINIEVFLGYGNTFKRTATLQQVQHILTPKKKDTGNSPKVGKTFENRNESLLPLHRE